MYIHPKHILFEKILNVLSYLAVFPEKETVLGSYTEPLRSFPEAKPNMCLKESSFLRLYAIQMCFIIKALMVWFLL